MRGRLGMTFLLAVALASCAQPPPPAVQSPPREGRALTEAPWPPAPPRPPRKPAVPEAGAAPSTPLPGETGNGPALETEASVPPASGSEGASRASAPDSESGAAAPTATPAPSETPAPAAQTAPPAPATAARPPQTAIVEAPAAAPLPPAPRLVGLNQAQIRGLLGPPGGREDAAPATIWRYPGRNCELAIYFYFDLKSQVMRALHYEVDSHGANELTGERCFAELIAAHQAGSQGATGADTPR